LATFPAGWLKWQLWPVPGVLSFLVTGLGMTAGKWDSLAVVVPVVQVPVLLQVPEKYLSMNSGFS
jgi:ABC-type anion transport system duplicated permease subunit